MAGNQSNTGIIMTRFLSLFLCLFMCVALAGLPTELRAQSNANSPDFDKDMLRLAEVLGSVHHLRTICHQDESQKWRDQMMKLIEADAKSPARRARLVNRFNTGYKNLKITYVKCDQTARQAELRFLSEGESLSRRMKRAQKTQQ